LPDLTDLCLLLFAAAISVTVLIGNPLMQMLAAVFTGPVIGRLFIWKAMIGFVVQVHHTHTRVDWYDNKKAWSAASAFVSAMVHLTFGAGIGAALHHIMEHTAHHVGMSVPLYRLKKAQALLEDKLPDKIILQRFPGPGISRPHGAASSTMSSAPAGRIFRCGAPIDWRQCTPARGGSARHSLSIKIANLAGITWVTGLFHYKTTA